MIPLARVASPPITAAIRVEPLGGRVEAGDTIQFGSHAVMGREDNMRSGTARVTCVQGDVLHFDANLNCLVPAVALGDYIFAYVEPCQRCRCDECVLRESQAARKMQSNSVGNEDDIAKLEAQVTAMRRLGVTKWGDIELGAAPAEAKEETQQQQDPEALEKRRRAAMHATAMSATGRLVPRLGEND